MSSQNRAIIYTLRISEAVMQALVFFIILLMLLYAFVSNYDTSIATCLLVSVIPVLALYFARLHVRNGVILFLIHICVAAFIITMGSTVKEKVAYGILDAALIIYSMSLCTRDRGSISGKLPIGFISVFFAAAILGNYIGSDNLIKAGIYGGEIYIILQVVYHNFRNVNDYIVKNRELTTLPVKQMTAVNSFNIAVLVTLCCGIMLLFRNSYVSKMLHSIVTWIKNAAIFVIRYLLSLGKYKEEEPILSDTIEEKGLSGLQALAQDKSALADILNGIGMVLGIVLLVLAIIAVTVGLIMSLVRLVRSMNSSVANGDIKEFIIGKEIKEFRVSRNRKDPTEKSSNARARKIYRSTVAKNAAKRRSTISPSMVPSEISQLYIPGDRSTATKIYEKARYSNQQVSQQEIEVLKKYRKA